MALQPLLSSDALAANMAELKPPFRPSEALVEAHRCLFCFDAPCIMACPTGIDVPAFIKKIAAGRPADAARTILSANILGASCARVCPTEVLCEGACVLDDRDEQPIQIGRLQRYVTDFVTERNISVLSAPAQKSGHAIAVIGAGPAGLGCAAELARLGHRVTIFEQKQLPGGLNTYGIAYYKMTPDVSLAEVDLVRSLGVEIRCGVTVGRDITVAQLEKEFAALFLGVGLGAATRLRIPGEDLPEVLDALDYIAQIHTQRLDKIPTGRRVAVIGAGNTAIDAVTQSKRLGADRSFIVYRRGEPEMSAYDFEYAHAKHDGAHFLFHAAPLEILATDGHVSGLRLVRTRLVGDRAEAIPGTEWIEPCDLVLKAVGQQKQAALLRSLFPTLALDDRGVVQRDPLTGATNLPHVFTGGDCANGGREVVNAVGEGKKAALGIHAFLTRALASLPVQPSRLGAKAGASGSGLVHPIRAHELEAALPSPARG
ncbi:NAD(P)-dependent oxidoreductase [Horticoccus luteus]|uniref:NAD(P)-dependent oxidoreductase n=1 Tax=Horticoccus luteus TaxID=2862869 RepID=A0A8F9XGE3_9BACT|nr:NAD(P)-dependent oxidoreductase [Horticoccus luteus]QYM78130.1 NAD(P)-dependent oxidoreductase [Horticoccus luteus]